MSEIDLIPVEYRQARRRDHVLRVLASAAGAVLIAALSAASGLAYAASRVHAQVSELELAHRFSDQQHTELANLQTERVRLEQQWTQLQALRGGSDVGELFRLIDRTVPVGDLWFDRWELQRDDNESKKPASASTAAVVVPAGAAQPAVDHAQMRIVGQARDHAALSRFVRELYESPEVDDVHLGRTELRRYTTTSVVSFDLAVALKDAP